MQSAFHAHLENEERSLRIIVRGELDFATASQFREVLHAAVERGAEVTVLDASELDFIDTVGIGLFVAQKRRAAAEGRTFVVSPSDTVATKIKRMGLAEYLGRKARYCRGSVFRLWRNCPIGSAALRHCWLDLA